MRGLRAQLPGWLTPELQPPTGSSCVLWLPGQDDAQSATIRDRSGNSNHGTIYGATWTRNSKGLWVLDFDGIDDYVDCGNNSILNFTSEDFAIENWVKVTTAAYHFLVVRGASGADGWEFYIGNTGASLWAGTTTNQLGAAQYPVTVAGAVTINTWTHIVANRIGANIRHYINGVDRSDVTAISNPATSTRALKLGKRDDSSSPTKGTIGLTLIHNRALSAAEIASPYQQKRHLFGV